jgi:chemotaxis protein methyltransferase CheR
MILLPAHLEKLSDLIAMRAGLYFPSAKWADLERGVVSSARELGVSDISQWIQRLVSETVPREQWDCLISHLTVGETYFFRDFKMFDILARQILPAVVQARRDGRRLGIWIAACCTGEEAYSIAIQVHQAFPSLRDWSITILATDINRNFIRKAETGVFGAWSFRGVPEAIKQQYFQPVGGRQYRIRPDIRQMVTFRSLNLVEDLLPGQLADTQAMDIIFCRNALLYFSPEQAERTMARLYQSQAEDGWLLTSASETSCARSTPYKPVEIDGLTVFRKCSSVPAMPTRRWVSESPAPARLPVRLVQKIAQPVHLPVESKPAQPAIAESREIARRARELADQGQLDEALEACDRWLAIDKTAVAGHYLKAIILYERGEIREAVRSLRRILFLDPEYVMAYFTLGRLAAEDGKYDDSLRHFEMSLSLLRGHAADDVVPGSDGITVGHFREMVRRLMDIEARTSWT